MPTVTDVGESVQSSARLRGPIMHLGRAGESQHFLAFVHRQGAHHLRVVNIPGLSSDQACRLQYAVVHLGKRRAIHTVQIYGHVDGPAAVVAAVSWLRSLGDVPALIVGDFNLPLGGTSVEPLLVMSGWLDVLCQAGPTCLSSSGALSRIDYVLANGPAMAHVTAAGLRWDLGLAKHAALELEVQVEPAEPAWMRRPARSLAGYACDG